ncbi:MAG: hypothetical protein OES13_09820 [Acidimicrobiia bacterium]|nr:hypothetical protein [Acidimicrobiia bacterium]
MAEITPTLQQKIDQRSYEYLWEQINEDDEGASIQILPAYADKSVHFYGTFNGGTLTLEHSMDNTNWTSAIDTGGDAIAVTAVGSVWVGTNARYWRIANDNAGTTEDVDVYLIVGVG